MNQALIVRALCKWFETTAGRFDALSDISFGVRAGEFAAIVGASGCGKSTLLRIIAGLEQPSGGEVLVEQRAIAGPGCDRAMVFQDYSLYPWLTVLENIRFSLRLGAQRRAATSAQVQSAAERSALLMELMGLTRVCSAHPHELSGGMRQRVAIALASNPRDLRAVERCRCTATIDRPRDARSHGHYVTSTLTIRHRRRPRMFCDVVTPQEPGFRLQCE